MPDEESQERSPIYGSLAQGGQFYRRPGARLSEPQDRSVLNLGGSAAGRHEGFHAFDKAHTVMLIEEGIIPAEEGKAILRGLREMEAKGVKEIRRESSRGPHAGEAWLIQEYGEDVGGWLHVGRSSHDLGSVSTRFLLRDRLLDAMEASLDLMEVYANRAEEHATTVVPTYTGLQHAQVATIGHHLLSFERPLERDFDRMLEAFDRVNISPAGAAVGTTSDFPINRDRVADLLGFDGVHDNAEDVDKSLDIPLEVSSVFAGLATTVARAADQFLIWYSKEFDLLDLPDRFCGTSSIMPQKKNPHAIESVQRDTNGVLGDLAEVLIASKNIGGGAGVANETLETVVFDLETWGELVDDVSFNAARGEELVYRDWALATDLAGAMVRECAIPWRTAHQITAILVRHAHEQGFGVRDVTTDDLDRAAEEYLGNPLNLDSDTLENVLDPLRAVQARNSVRGSPAPEQVRAQAESTREFVTFGRDAVERRRERLEEAEGELEATVDEIAS